MKRTEIIPWNIEDEDDDIPSLHLLNPSLTSLTLPLHISLQTDRVHHGYLILGRGKAASIKIKPSPLVMQCLPSIKPNANVLSRQHVAITFSENKQYELIVRGRTWINGKEHSKGSKVILVNDMEISLGDPAFECQYVVENLPEPQKPHFAEQYSIGLGTLALSVLYPIARPARTAALALLRSAIVQHGVRFIDVADSYCGNATDFHYAERLVGEVLQSLPSDIDRSTLTIATKGGMERYGDGTVSGKTWRPTHMTPASLRKCIRDSRAALGVDTIDLWQIHHSDGMTGTSKEFTDLIVAANVAIGNEEVARIGLCNCSCDHVRTAYELLNDSLATVSNAYNLFDRTGEKPDPKTLGKTVAKSNKHGVVALCQQLGLTFLAYAPLGGLQLRDGRRDLLKSFPALITIAQAHAEENVAPHHVALAWMRQKWTGTLVPLVGLRKKEHLNGLKELKDFVLTANEMSVLDKMKDAEKGQKRKR